MPCTLPPARFALCALRRAARAQLCARLRGAAPSFYMSNTRQFSLCCCRSPRVAFPGLPQRSLLRLVAPTKNACLGSLATAGGVAGGTRCKGQPVYMTRGAGEAGARGRREASAAAHPAAQSAARAQPRRRGPHAPVFNNLPPIQTSACFIQTVSSSRRPAARSFPRSLGPRQERGPLPT